MNILDIANWFLSKQSMSHKKLQKLCYYSQAWTLALLNKKLFEQNFEAWVHGPVNKILFDKYKNYGWNLIPKIEKQKIIFDNEILNVLNAVYNTYGALTPNQLEWQTHQEKPWINARLGLDEWTNSNNIIDDEDMKVFYKNQYIGD